MPSQPNPLTRMNRRCATAMKLNSFTGSNATHCSPASTLTPDILADCVKLLANPPAPIPRADYFVNPQVMEALKKESVPATHPISSMLGMPFFVMENQKAQGWLISDPLLAKAYRDGDITEEQLARFHERVQEICASKENVTTQAPL